jgi:succinate-acetate transporter protein
MTHNANTAQRPREERADSNGIPPQPTVFLQPISPPASFGLFGFFGSTMVLSTWILGWWGGHSPTEVGYFFVFNAAIGGLVQFLAGIWSFKARDYIASALLTMWGTYWMGWGILQAFGAAKILTLAPLAASQPGFAIWFIPLGLFTFWGAVAALSPRHGNLPLFVLLFTVGVGCWLLCIGLWSANVTWTDVAAWFLVVGACAAWYVGSMSMLLSSWRKVVLPLGKFERAANRPGQRLEFPSEYAGGHPGVRQGHA